MANGCWARILRVNLRPIHIVGCAHNPNTLVYLLYAACLLSKLVAITSQNLVKKTRFCSIIA